MTRASDTARLLGAGATILDGTTISTADNTAQLTLTSTDADSGIGPHQVFYRNSSSPADADLLCELDFRGRNDNSQDVNYATVNVKASDVSDGTEDGEYILQVMTAGSVDTTMHIKPSEIVFNEDSIDRDFRVESNGNANMLFVDGGNDRIGIGTNSPQKLLHLKDGDIVVGNGTASNNAVIGRVGFSTDASNSRFIGMESFRGGDAANGDLRFHTFGGDGDNGERMRIDTAGRVGIGTTSISNKLEVDGGSAQTRLRVSTTGTDLREAGIILANSSKSNANDGIVISHGGAVTTFDDLGGNELMRIAQTGNHAQLLINLTDTTPFNSGAPGMIIALNDGTRYGAIFGCDQVANRDAVVFVNPNGEVGSIKTSAGSTSYNTSSDYRLKENVNYSFDATSRIKQLKPCRFNFIVNAGTTVDGFLAHEVSDIVPEAVSGEKDAIHVWKDGEDLPDGVSVGDKKVDANGKDLINAQSIDQSKLVPLLVKTIQELEARITTLENA